MPALKYQPLHVLKEISLPYSSEDHSVLGASWAGVLSVTVAGKKRQTLLPTSDIASSRPTTRPFKMMEDFNSETDSDYTSYWRDWVSPVTSVYHFGLWGIGRRKRTAQLSRTFMHCCEWRRREGLSVYFQCLDRCLEELNTLLARSFLSSQRSTAFLSRQNGGPYRTF